MIDVRDLALPGRLDPADLRFEAGARVALIGPNGGGKTSLLRAMAGVEDARGGVAIDGESVATAVSARRRAMLGYLPASRDLNWPIAVRDVIALGLDRPDARRLETLLALFELERLAARPADQLSTGERARVLMARVMASEPRFLLLDEPLSNLDPYWVLRFLEIIDAEAERGATVLVALHDLSQVSRFDRALLISRGRVMKDGTPDKLIADPAFEEAFRVLPAGNGFAISPTAGRQSSR